MRRRREDEGPLGAAFTVRRQRWGAAVPWQLTRRPADPRPGAPVAGPEAATRAAHPVPPRATTARRAAITRRAPGPPSHPPHRAGDVDFGRELRSAAGLTALMYAALLLVDLGNGTLDLARGVCWTAVAALFLAVLLPTRITAGDGWLTSRTLLRRRTVRTDLLVSVRLVGGVVPRLLLRDAYGATAWVGLRVLHANPLLWHALERGARTARRRRVLADGGWLLTEVGRDVDDDRARRLLRAADLG
ncbi:hypothetical protein AAHZ94_24315 [Streptomyces sp. HSW2009]|uniref:hypothetical protein n=1 Tax=Streptomyces sp. HSW2009 TaxID=3142890 RepID=UPI0032EBD1BC